MTALGEKYGRDSDTVHQSMNSITVLIKKTWASISQSPISFDELFSLFVSKKLFKVAESRKIYFKF